MSLVIIHLTDIHIKDSNDLVLAKAGKVANACACHLHSDDEVIIAVSGDVAFSGKREQYEAAQGFINTISVAITAKTMKEPCICIVPGNHDCDFPHDESVREALIESCLKHIQDDGYSRSIIEQVGAYQVEYNSFAKKMCSPIATGDILCKTVELNLKIGNILVLMLNTAWISTLHEKPGNLCMPHTFLPQFDVNKYDLVISIAHHPSAWMHPDNAVKYCTYLRSTTDLLLLGHEHRSDAIALSGNGWNTCQRNGKELQEDSHLTSSAFSLYVIDGLFEEIITYDYCWNDMEAIYKQEAVEQTMFKRNCVCGMSRIIPNKETYKRLNDYGTLIQHFRAESFALSDLYCWPDLEQLSFTGDEGRERFVYNTHIDQVLLEQTCSIIVGDSLSGKTSMSKMLYLTYISHGKCCLLLSAKCINTHTVKGIDRIIDSEFKAEYSDLTIDRFHQLSKESKVLIIDDFEQLAYNDENRVKILSYLSEVFSNIILFSGTDADLSVLLAKLYADDNIQIAYYRIRYLGHVKRRQLIEKWYSLGGTDMEDEHQLEFKVSNAELIVNNVFGRASRLAPAKPIHVVGILQSINAAGQTTFSNSRYGYLYDELVRRSITAVVINDESAVNICMAVLSEIAYGMFVGKVAAFDETQMIETALYYIKEMALPIRPVEIINLLVQARIFHINKDGKYRFRYKYLYYYFVGRYMANHLSEQSILDSIEDMSGKLYNESYGNIMIFVCHFSNSQDVINSVMIRAYYTLDGEHAFDFKDPSTVSSLANDSIEKALLPRIVGEEKDVSRLRTNDLANRDKQELEKDSATDENSDVWRNDEIGDKEAASVISALKITDVLGQILRNYPGDIPGKVKREIIEEINLLSMRTLQVFMRVFGYMEDDLIDCIADDIQKKNKDAVPSEVINRVKEAFSALLLQISYGMINRIATSIGSRYLLPSAEEAVNAPNPSLSLQLAVVKVKLLCYAAPPYEDIINLNRKLKNDKLYFSSGVLGLIVANYLRSNHVGIVERDRLCAEFNLDKASVTPPVKLSPYKRLSEK